MDASFSRLGRGLLVLMLAAGACGAWAQADGKNCVVLFVHGKGASPQSLVALSRKVQPVCAGRSPEMPWSARRGAERDSAAAIQEITAQVKALRQQGYKRVVLAGQGLGANAAIAYAASPGDADAVVALGGDAAPGAGGFKGLPALAPQIPQNVPLLWMVGSGDPLREQGEDYAFAKAPPHPASRFMLLKSDIGRAPEAAAGPLLEWLKSTE